MAPLLKLADKYDMENISKTFLPRITQDWPIALSQWDRNEDTIRALENFDDAVASRHGMNHRGFLDDILVEPCGPIRFGRRSAPNILPSAFYHLSRLEFIDWSQDEYGDDMIEFCKSNKRSADTELLTPEDWHTLEVGRTSMGKWIRWIASSGYIVSTGWSKDPHDIAPGRPCPGLERYWRDSIQLQILDFQGCGGEHDFLAGTKAMLDNSNRFNDEVCARCAHWAQTSISRARSDFWTALPKLFGLKPVKWDDDFH